MLKEKEGPEVMRGKTNWKLRLKLAGALILALLCILIVLLNLEPTEIQLLVMSVKMPLAILIFATSMMGFGIGVLAAMIWAKRDGK
jgi:uncharacterized integral membrane protein